MLGMTPKEYTDNLMFEFRQVSPSSVYTGIDTEEAKQCMLIMVKEIMKVEQAVKMNFWKAVLKEIESR